MSAGEGRAYPVLSGLCPDVQCRTKLFFPAHDSSVECTGCGQRHQRTTLLDVQEVRNPEVALHNILKNLLVGNFKPKKGSDSIKVLGVSNYQCKLLSPILTRYGMDKRTGEARSLAQMGQGEAFDCGVLASRAFLIEPEHIEVTGYGRDSTGSMRYLEQTLAAVRQSNDGEERLLPIHADGDGHCLVHAISRALIGRELFWHALRQNLKQHFTEKLADYKQLFRDFIDVDEWKDIIAESDPEYVPQGDELMGLRNIHVFGLANVLRRPIVLVDSLRGMQSSGDYTGVFLPGLQPPEKCRDKDGILHKPLCLAWSNSGHNHYIALVGVKGRPVPKLPSWMIPKAWGMPQELIPTYIDLDDHGRVEIGGDKILQDKYVLKLVNAMEKVFEEKYQVRTSVIADYHQFVLKSTGMVGVAPERVVQQTQSAVAERRLFRCLVCEALMEWTIDAGILEPGGALYDLAVKIHGSLAASKEYSFPTHDIICSYDAERDALVPKPQSSGISKCRWCQGSQVRLLKGDDTVMYENGDRTLTPTSDSNCRCGFKHFWEGQEYDNLPELLPVVLEWTGKVIKESVPWFQYESDVSLNSNVFEVAQKLVQKYFPGEFGSERLVQKVVDTILAQTKMPSTDVENANALCTRGAGVSHAATDASWRADASSKIILTGFKSKTMHKEELTKSKTEKEVKRRLEENASVKQRKMTDAVQSAKREVDETKESVEVKESKEVEANVPQQKKVRVSTSDGRQLTISLEEHLTFSQLINHLEHDLKTSREQMKVRHGIPPKELSPSMENGEEIALPLQHGDRITVEIIAQHKQAAGAHAPWPLRSPSRKSWSSFDSNAHNHSANDLLNQLTQLQDRSECTDSLDTSIASLALMASLMGKDLWAYVQGMPHLFSIGGLFYQQVVRDMGLTDGKHCSLPSLQNKVFRYNAKEDRLELCLEPHGHYPVEPNIEAKVLSMQPADYAVVDLQSCLNSGSDGIAVNQPMQSACGSVAFSGHGQAVGAIGDDRMPQDLDMPTTHAPKLKATKLTHFSHSGSRPNSIEEEDEEEKEEKEEEVVEEEAEHTYRRVGPGYSVLDHSNTETETFQALASKLDSLVQDMETEGSGDDSPSKGDA